MTRIVCISDTHGFWDCLKVPEGDLLIHAGDIARFGEVSEYEAFNQWLGKQPHRHKVVIAGNHDKALALRSVEASQRLLLNAHYLQNSGIVVDGVKIWGSPYTPLFMDWHFMHLRGSEELKAVWEQIPADTDILVTHGPPFGKCDYSAYRSEHAGCVDLREVVLRHKPKLHVFGHIHGSYGTQLGEFTTFINASVVNEAYAPVNSAIEIELTEE